MNNYCFDIVDYRLFFLNIEERQTRNSFYKIDFTLGAEKKVQGFKHTTAMRQKRKCGAVFVESYSTTTILSSFTTTCDPFFLYSLLESAQNSVFTSIRSKKINLSIFLAILIHDSKNSIVQLVT